jgi:hypothetical protein
MKLRLGMVIITLLFIIGCSAEDRFRKGDENEMMDETALVIPERFREFNEERQKTRLGYIIEGPYTPAVGDMDLQRMERFVFSSSNNTWGYGLVIDKRHGRVYYEPNHSVVWDLDQNSFSAAYTDQDLDRLIAAIEESGLLDWDDYYLGHNDGTTASSGWSFGMLFDDGTMLRRGGSGMVGGSPPDGQLRVFLDYVRSMGEEIEARHHAEADKEP